MIQRISESSMEEEIEIPLKDGQFYFPHGKDKIFCPLIREEFGSIQRDKMAMFYDEELFPLPSSILVNLRLTYHYGDPDSYKLIATPMGEAEKQVQSQWCDKTDQVMGNDRVPEYSSPVIKYKADEASVNDALIATLQQFSNSHHFTMHGYHGGPPFYGDQQQYWTALKSISWIRLSLPYIFAPNHIEKCQPETIRSAEIFLSKSLSLYEDCWNGTLDSGNPFFPCDLDDTSIDKIMGGLLNMMSLMGALCSAPAGIDQGIIDDMVADILDSNHLQYILSLSTYVTRDDDPYGIWDRIDQLLEQSSKEQRKNAIRSIGAVCWRQPDWIYQFGQCENSVLQSIIDTVIVSCRDEAGKIAAWPRYNPRPIRDMLEAFLGITRLKATNPFVKELLNCNSSNIKRFVENLKELNEVMQANAAKFDYPFVGRLEMVVPDELHNVSSVIYPIIEILTDGNAVKLTGFMED